MTVTVDTAKLPMLLTALRLPAFARLWPEFCARANREGCAAERLLAALAEARLLPGKTLDTFDFSGVPTVTQARVRALAAGCGPGMTCWPSAHRAPANPIWDPPSDMSWSSADTAC